MNYENYRKPASRELNFPLLLTLSYLFATFVLFFFGKNAREIDNMFSLIIFVVSAYLLFGFGYFIGIYSKRNRKISLVPFKTSPRLIVLCSIYYFALGASAINSYGLENPLELIRSIVNPGEAYKARFDTELVVSKSLLVQILNLCGILYAGFIPFLVASWSKLSRKIKIISALSLIVYIVSFLAIGTLKGIGHLLLMAIPGFLYLLYSGQMRFSLPQKRKIKLIGISAVMVFCAYMITNQSSRMYAYTGDLGETVITEDVSQSYMADVFGEKFAFGFSMLLAYPSHGYEGLALSLQLPFEFSNFAGLSPAFESYKDQYIGPSSNIYSTYPYRVEQQYGRSATMVWSTIFPWLASDLTFIGCLVVMGLVGFIFARAWLSVLVNPGFLSLAILGQIFVFIAFIPSNNQILMTRQGFWVVINILVLLAAKKIFKGGGAWLKKN